MPFLDNLKCKVPSTKSGFTLVELLVVLGILTLTVGSSLLFLTSVLKGTNQANIISEAKQNGQSTLDSLDRQIRNATNAQAMISGGTPPLNLPAGASSGVALTISGNQSLYIVCFNSVAGTSNGWIGTASLAPGTSPSLSDFKAVTNIDTISGADVSSCNIAVTSFSVGAISPPIVAINFTMNQGINAPSRKDFLANSKFQTTISLRNYSE